MARAIICDRCGTVFSDNVSTCRYTLFDAKKAEDLQWTGRYREKIIGDMVDLCDKCSIDLALFVEEKKIARENAVIPK